MVKEKYCVWEILKLFGNDELYREAKVSVLPLTLALFLKERGHFLAQSRTACSNHHFICEGVLMGFFHNNILTANILAAKIFIPQNFTVAILASG